LFFYFFSAIWLLFPGILANILLENAGLPFNFPYTRLAILIHQLSHLCFKFISNIPKIDIIFYRFCTPCSFTEPISAAPTGLDSICLDYAYGNCGYDDKAHKRNAYNDGDQVPDNLRVMLYNMQSNKDEYFYIVKSYLFAKDDYEARFNRRYNFSAFVLPMKTGPSCIQIYQQGSGFISQRNVMLTNGTLDQLFLNGLTWEQNFLDGLRDLWLSKACHGSKHVKTVK